MLFTTLIASAALIAGSVARGGPAAKTTHGEVVGKVLNGKVKAWLGVPFAQSPPERFSPPKEPKKWKNPRETTKLPAACIQQFNYPAEARNLTMQIFNMPAPKESEDCLYLNVWAPLEPPPPGGFPVLFWIYGGNLQFGATALDLYQGQNIAKNQKVVVVSTNYRTNVFGFPNSPELAKGQNNLGFLDQRLALDWTQKNVASFGGDPKKVTIFGESAGGYSVKQLIANPPSPLPFRAAIMQSQASGVRGGAESWAKLAEGLKCNATGQLACVRAATASQIKDTIEKARISFAPQEDGVTHVQDVRANIAAGKTAKVPIIIGTNQNEGTPFSKIGLSAPGSTLTKFFGTFVPGGDAIANFVLNELRPLYVGPEYNTEEKLGGAIFTDLGFTCPAKILSQSLVNAGYDVSRYYYVADFPETYPFANAGAYHTAEIEAIFGTYDRKNKRIPRVSAVMQSLWADHAKGLPLPGWPKLSKTDETIKKFDIAIDTLVKADDVVDKRCAVVGPFAEGAGI